MTHQQKVLESRVPGTIRDFHPLERSAAKRTKDDPDYRIVFCVTLFRLLLLPYLYRIFVCSLYLHYTRF
jgi:hypothetical protein